MDHHTAVDAGEADTAVLSANLPLYFAMESLGIQATEKKDAHDLDLPPSRHLKLPKEWHGQNQEHKIGDHI